MAIKVSDIPPCTCGATSSGYEKHYTWSITRYPHKAWCAYIVWYKTRERMRQWKAFDGDSGSESYTK